MPTAFSQDGGTGAAQRAKTRECQETWGSPAVHTLMYALEAFISIIYFKSVLDRIIPRRSIKMSSQPLADLWDSAAGQPYEPFIGKDSQFAVGFTLLAAGTVETCSPEGNWALIGL